MAGLLDPPPQPQGLFGNLPYLRNIERMLFNPGGYAAEVLTPPVQGTLEALAAPVQTSGQALGGNPSALGMYSEGQQPDFYASGQRPGYETGAVDPSLLIPPAFDIAGMVEAGSLGFARPANSLGTGGRTYQHPISAVKLKTPIEEMNPTYKQLDLPMLPERPLDFESLEGGWVIPMRGDPTIAGVNLTGVGGKTFEQPVTSWGGPGFSRGPQQVAEGAGWASMPAPSTTLSNRAARIHAETGEPVYGAYMKMSPTSGDYSTMMTETLREMLKLKMPSRDARRAFNKAMREPWGGFEAIPDFPGVEKMSDEWIKSAGKGRTKLAQLMDSKRFGDMGFPEVGVARHALTEPDLLDAPSHSSGFSVVEFDPAGRVIKDPKIIHPTYAQQNVAAYKGRIADDEGRFTDLPLDVLYGPEVRASAKPEHLAKILETKPPSVLVDAKTIKRVTAYLRSRDGAKLGLAGAVAAGVLTAEQAKELEGT